MNRNKSIFLKKQKFFQIEKHKKYQMNMDMNMNIIGNGIE
jgi:hypothetical protein